MIGKLRQHLIKVYVLQKKTINVKKQSFTIWFVF